MKENITPWINDYSKVYLSWC